jgi:small subunit ribosomal protein S18
MAIYRRKLSPIKNQETIDYKDVELLSKFLTEQGKLLPRRVTGLTTKQQIKLTKAVKRARILALLPFVNKEF